MSEMELMVVVIFDDRKPELLGKRQQSHAAVGP